MTLLIKNVVLLGTSQKFSDKMDVFMSGEKISAIGKFTNKKADEIFDGQGAYLAPGFIDVNTDSDHYLSLFDYPSQEDFLRQGVTTIIGGHCGASLAPLLYGGLESIQKWTDISKFNVDWHTMEEFFKVFDRKPLGVNFMTLIGHSTIRRAMVGEQLRELSQNELIVFGETLRRGMLEGAVGFSTGLGYVHSRNTPYSEIKFLAKIVNDYHGIYTTHLRDSGEDIVNAVQETIKVAQETGCRTIISHFVPFKGYEKQYEAALKIIEALPDTVECNFDVYPFNVSALPLYTYLPFWAQNGGRDVMMGNVRDSWMQPRILADFPILEPSHLIIARADANSALVGKTLDDFMKMQLISDPRQGLLKLMLTTELKASLFDHNINYELLTKALVSKRSLIASNAASFSPQRHEEKLERTTKTFIKFLGMMQEEKLMSLEDAIYKITTLPAKKLNLRGRGEIKEGNYADLVVFRDNEIRCTVVGGNVVWKDGTFQGKLAGKALRHTGY